MAKTKSPTLADVKNRIKGLDPDQARRVVCALVGHTRVVAVCFGQITCERCEGVIGDTLMGTGDEAREAVIVGHRSNGAPCNACRHQAKSLTSMERFMLVPRAALEVRLLRGRK